MSKPMTRTTLCVTGLEARDTPAALASFSAVTGQLTVTIDNTVSTGQAAFISEAGGQVFLNGRRVIANGTTVASNRVHSIVVNGSAFDNAINLAGVSTKGFSGLDGRVTINGGGGNDTIYGSQFGDAIHAGIGNDRVFGGAGRDRIWGEAGNDNIWGDFSSDVVGDADMIDGGSGDDTLRGGGGNDVLIGGTGKDTIFGGAGSDIAWIDAADFRFAHGWQWAGVEVTRTGTPPRI